MNERKYLNNEWKFTEDATREAVRPVRIPHTCRELPYHYFDDTECQMLCKYERALFIMEEWSGKTLLLTFEGAAHDAKVYINDTLIGEHRCGYTAFTLDITHSVQYGKSNRITVILDTRESLNIPPFGGYSDFLAYGGIYREVWLDIKEPTYIRDIYIQTQYRDNRAQAISRVDVCNVLPATQIRQSIRPAGSEQDFTDVGFVNADRGAMRFTLGNAESWAPDHPALYELRTELLQEGKVADSRVDRIGFREAEFRKDGFYLNGEKLKIRGISRSQSYPYVGYAMPASIQRQDADILKYELGVNAVRAAHYPHSQAFIDRCDELGLLVFSEIPGWKYVGDTGWMNQEIENTKELIVQYRNHPSIILWGTRVGESDENDAFYEKTNRLAHSLDPSRPTTGIRNTRKAQFVEDVYSYNDFSYNGNNRPCRKKSAVTSDMDKSYLISAFNGPMIPTKAYDGEARSTEHALRYARVLDAVENEEDIAGSFGWCLTDYNSHRNFGSSDRICYHGVMDMFRNPKFAANAYRVYSDSEPILEVSSSLVPGENPGNMLGDVYLFTNADSVRMYRDGQFIKEYVPKGHLPILIDDFVGDSLEDNLRLEHDEAMIVKAQINQIARTGEFSAPAAPKKRLFGGSRAEGLSGEELTRIYEELICGNGGKAITYRFDAIQNGEVAKTLLRRPVVMHDLEIRVSSLELHDDRTYDVAAIRFRALDQDGNLLSLANDPIALKAEGAIEIIGSKLISLQGGMGGTYVRTNGKTGVGKLLLTGLRGLQVPGEFHIGDGRALSSRSGGHGYEIVFKVE